MDEDGSLTRADRRLPDLIRYQVDVENQQLFCNSRDWENEQPLDFFRECAARSHQISVEVFMLVDAEDLGEEFVPIVQASLAEWRAEYPLLSIALHVILFSSHGPLSLRFLAAKLNQIADTYLLHSLRFEGVALISGDAELLAQALHRHAQLAIIIIRNCIERSGRAVLDLATAISTHPNVRNVAFQMDDAPDQQRMESMALLARTPSLRSLDISGWPQEADLQVFLDAIDKRSTSIILNVADSSRTAINTFVRLLEQNTKIEALNVPFLNTPQIGALAMALTSNTTLRELGLGLGYRWEADAIEPFSSLLETSNFTLGKLDFPHAEQSMTQTVHNLWERVQFLLRLNKDFQRKRLMAPTANATPKDWKEVVMVSKDDVSASFYYLSQNPSILN